MLLLLTLLTSCQAEGITSGELLETVLSEHPHLPSAHVLYQSDALPGQQAYMSKRLQSLLYDEGRGRSLPELSQVVDYAVCLSDGIYGMEIHIFRMKSPYDARNMKKLLLRRAELMKRRSLYLFAPEAYENYLCSAAVYREDEYVFLLCTGENEQIAAAIRERIG